MMRFMCPCHRTCLTCLPVVVGFGLGFFVVVVFGRESP